MQAILFDSKILHILFISTKFLPIDMGFFTASRNQRHITSYRKLYRLSSNLQTQRKTETLFFQRFRTFSKSARWDSNFILSRKAHKNKEECTLSAMCLQLWFSLLNWNNNSFFALSFNKNIACQGASEAIRRRATLDTADGANTK